MGPAAVVRSSPQVRRRPQAFNLICQAASVWERLIFARIFGRPSALDAGQRRKIAERYVAGERGGWAHGLASLPNFNWRDQSVQITIIATLVCADQ